MRDDRETLRDILEAIERIERHTQRGRASFEHDELIQTWVVHHLEILREAARGISQHVQDETPNIPWRAMIAMRNVLAHDYFGVDVERVWTTVEHDLPDLKIRIVSVLRRLEDH